MNPLEMKVNTTQAGLYTVTYGRIEAPLDVQEAAFAVHGLHTVSPEQLAFLRSRGGDTFKLYSRTSADVFYDDRTDRVVIVPNGKISEQVGINNLVDAHREEREYVISSKKQKESVYALVDAMLKEGTAFTAPHVTTQVPTLEFGKNDLTSRLFSDESLEFNAQEYGEWLQSQGMGVNTFFMDEQSYSKDQRGPYLNRLRVFGPGCDFFIVSSSGHLDDNHGAFGVSFKKTAEGGAKK